MLQYVHLLLAVFVTAGALNTRCRCSTQILLRVLSRTEDPPSAPSTRVLSPPTRHEYVHMNQRLQAPHKTETNHVSPYVHTHHVARLALPPRVQHPVRVLARRHDPLPRRPGRRPLPPPLPLPPVPRPMYGAPSAPPAAPSTTAANATSPPSRPLPPRIVIFPRTSGAALDGHPAAAAAAAASSTGTPAPPAAAVPPAIVAIFAQGVAVVAVVPRGPPAPANLFAPEAEVDAAAVTVIVVIVAAVAAPPADAPLVVATPPEPPLQTAEPRSAPLPRRRRGQPPSPRRGTTASAGVNLELAPSRERDAVQRVVVTVRTAAAVRHPARGRRGGRYSGSNRRAVLATFGPADGPPGARPPRGRRDLGLVGRPQRASRSPRRRHRLPLPKPVLLEGVRVPGGTLLPPPLDPKPPPPHGHGGVLRPFRYLGGRHVSSVGGNEELGGLRGAGPAALEQDGHAVRATATAHVSLEGPPLLGTSYRLRPRHTNGCNNAATSCF